MKELLNVLLINTWVTPTKRVLYLSYLDKTFSVRTRFHWMEGYLRYVTHVDKRDFVRFERANSADLLLSR
jgi:hypothetical protein